jgi:predicted anti-sigma-YlaC factor YlaD
MNCDTAQRRLLGSERPDEPPAEVEAHLAACAACRTWQQRLATRRTGRS